MKITRKLISMVCEGAKVSVRKFILTLVTDMGVSSMELNTGDKILLEMLLELVNQ